MKYFFFVQSEGRGHMTQALALKEKLETRGHQIVGLAIGCNRDNNVPVFFKEATNCPLFTVASPKFVIDKQQRGVKIFASTLITLGRLPLYLSSLKKIKRIINDLKPDVLINFYEPLAGNYYRWYRDKRPMFCIGHQHFIEHPSFKFPRLSLVARLSFKFYNRLSAPTRATRIALSFTAEVDQPQKKLFVCPPLIRRSILNRVPADHDFTLVYLLNPGYGSDIVDWCLANPKREVVVFWNRAEKLKELYNNLTFYYLSGENFINHLVNCSNYASTAGFDSVAEAAYLQKNILLVPTKNHFEQKCNALDAKRSGLAQVSDRFDISLLNSPTKNPSSPALQLFKEWVDKFDDKIVELLEK